MTSPRESPLLSPRMSPAMSPRGPRGVVTPTPATILGALYHSHFYAADPGISLSIGKVTSWPNRGTDGAPAVQGTSSARPAYSATSFQGGPGLTFDGTDDELLATFAGALTSAKRPYVWVVFVRQGTTFGYGVALVDTKPLTQYWLTLKWDVGPTCVMQRQRQRPAGGDTLIGPVSSNTVPGLGQFCLPSNGLAGLVYNGTVTATVSGTDAIGGTLAKLQFGMISAGTQPGNMILAEVIIASDEPTPTQIAAVNTYLKAPARNNGLGYGLP